MPHDESPDNITPKKDDAGILKLPAGLQRSKAESEEFKWDDDDIVLREQRCTAIYWNPAGDLVIRQRADWDEHADPFLVIGANNVHDFIDRLCDVAGIPSAGRP